MQTRSLSLLGMLYLLVFIAAINFICSKASYASDFGSEPSIFYTYENNDLGYITGVGVAFGTTFEADKFGVEFTTSLNSADILTKDGFREDYFAWEGSMAFGYFSDIIIYAEVGVDLTELIFKDIRDDDCRCDRCSNCNNREEYSENIDAFIGFGSGFKADAIKLEAFARLRKIDSDLWDAGTNWFAGIKFSISF